MTLVVFAAFAQDAVTFFRQPSPFFVTGSVGTFLGARLQYHGWAHKQWPAPRSRPAELISQSLCFWTSPFSRGPWSCWPCKAVMSRFFPDQGQVVIAIISSKTSRKLQQSLSLNEPELVKVHRFSAGNSLPCLRRGGATFFYQRTQRQSFGQNDHSRAVERPDHSSNL